MLTVHIAAPNITSNNGSNTHINPSHDCEGNATSDECSNKLISINETPKSDTVLQYVYKKDDKSVVREKPKGHPLNSIQRKKRYIKNEKKGENITGGESVKAPLIVDYETLHPPGDTESILPQQRPTGNSIQNSALADFNIVTSHDPIQPSQNHFQKESSSSQSVEDDKESSENKNYKQSDSYESSESDYLKKGGNPIKQQTKHSDSDEAKEREKYKNKERGSSSVEDSREIYDEDSDANAVQKPRGSFEKLKEKSSSPNNVPKLNHISENSDSAERENSRSNENSESNESTENTSRDTHSNEKHEDKGGERNKNSKYRSRESSDEQNSNESSDRGKAYKNQDVSNESDEKSYENNYDKNLLRPSINKQLQENDKHGVKSIIGVSTPRSIQDIDLGDFSYERVKVDDKGHVVVDRDHNENNSPVKPLVSPNLDKASFTESLSPKEDTGTSLGLNVGSPVLIDDVEIKPVVEINSEHNNQHESNEENSKEALKANPDNYESLETILGTKINDSEEQNEKVTQENEPEEKADVKQQFERIPVNYKHKNKQQKDDSNEQGESESQTEKENEEMTKSEGTLDTFSPKDIKYDEHLNFKFDDIKIKLPEIKLPEDILAYAYEEPVPEKNKDKYQKPKDKPKFYQYSDEDSSESKEEKDDSHPKQIKAKQNDDSEESNEQTHKPNKINSEENDYTDHDHYDYKHKPTSVKQKLRKKGDDEEDEDEDLYEKFVRERFGKRGSFQKRSEKLLDARDLPYNPKLYDNVHKILKKTAQIDEQAKKSGDPNAGYAWTLEYGENLK